MLESKALMKTGPESLAHLSRNERACLASFREKLLAAFPGNVKEVILFGSKARGDDAPASDFDILVLVDFLDRELRNKVYDLAADLEEENHFAIQLSPLVWESKYFERLLSHERRIALDVHREGVRM